MSEMDVEEDTVADFEWPALFISIVPRITGSLSVVSSSTIIFLIYRSDAKLTTIYHRIMFCMSICDIIGSTAMGLTTIPMPKEMPLEQELGFEWPGGNRYGNTLSCNLQGFSFTFGTLSMFGLNVMLCFYYACSIAFQMKEINIRKYAQPIIYGLPLAVGLSFATVPLFTDLMNPPTNFQKGYWCLPTTYPFGCADEDTCTRGGKYVNVLEKREKALMYTAMVSVLIMVVSLLLVIGRVMRTGCLLRRQGIAEKKQQNNIDDLFQRWEMINEDDDDEDSDEDDNSFGPKRLHPLSRAGMGQISTSAKLKFRKRSLLRSSTFERVSRIQLDTKVVIFQAILYILAFFGGLAWTFNTEIDVQAFKFGLIFVPSQGIFNLLIFLWHKIYNYRRQHRETPACQVVRLLFTTPVQEAFFVSRISLVLDDEFDTEGAVCDNDMPLRLPPFQIHHEMSEEEIMKMINTCEFEKTKLNSDNMERCGISEGAGDDMLEDFPIDSSNANTGNVNDYDFDNTNPQVQELPPLSAKRIYRRRGTLNTSYTSNNTSGTGLTRSTTTALGISDRTIDNNNFFPVSLRASDSSVNGMPGQVPNSETETDRSSFHHREGHSLHLIAGSGNDNIANNNINAEFTSSSNDTYLRLRLALLQEEEQMTRNMQDKDTPSSHCEDLSIDGLSGFTDLSVGVPSSARIETDSPSALNSAKLSEHQGFHRRTETSIDSECDSSCS